MIRIKRIDHINMRVKNLRESSAFYHRYFGFAIKEDHSGDPEPWVIIGVPGVAYLCMYEHPAKERPTDALTLNHFGFAVEDFDAVAEFLRKDGIKFQYGGIVQWPRSRSIYIRDPNGYDIELAEKVGGELN